MIFDMTAPPQTGRIFTAEASTLGWRPGHWPNTFKTENKVWHKTFVQESKDEPGEIAFVKYTTDDGAVLTVWND